MNFVRAIQDFQRARTKAGLEEILARLRGKSTKLLSYEEVRQKLHVTNMTARGLHDIPVDNIVGSVDRYRDFTRSFLPKSGQQEERWAKVKSLTEASLGLPPIEVYQIGEVYFVSDGNHRVSVAREMGLSTVQAYVTEIKTKVPLEPNTQPDELIIKGEYADFLNETKLDVLRPEADFTVTAAGKYEALKEHIKVHQYFMGLDQDRGSIPDDEAVEHWHDHVYKPIVDIIRHKNLLQDFPNRTETDLYLWLNEYRAELSDVLGWDISPEDAASDLARNHSPNTGRRVGRLRDKLIDTLTPDELETGPAAGQWRRERVESRPDPTCLFKAILVPISGQESGWFALEQALEMARQEKADLLGLHVIPKGGSEADAQAIKDEFEWRCQAAMVKGRLSIETGNIVRSIGERSHWADLIVLYPESPPGDSALSKLKSGSRSIIRRWARPVLTVRNRISSFERALVAYDGSPKAQEALFVATYLAARHHTELTVLSVAASNINDKTLDEARHYLEERNIQASYLFLREAGPVSNTLLKQATALSCDLLVMGGYGQQPVVEMVLGSAVGNVLRQAEMPVLICR